MSIPQSPESEEHHMHSPLLIRGATRQATLSIAWRLLELGMSHDVVQAVTGLTKEDLQRMLH